MLQVVRGPGFEIAERRILFRFSCLVASDANSYFQIRLLRLHGWAQIIYLDNKVQAIPSTIFQSTLVRDLIHIFFKPYRLPGMITRWQPEFLSQPIRRIPNRPDGR
jgi:hypothetical protein